MFIFRSSSLQPLYILLQLYKCFVHTNDYTYVIRFLLLVYKLYDVRMSFFYITLWHVYIYVYIQQHIKRAKRQSDVYLVYINVYHIQEKSICYKVIIITNLDYIMIKWHIRIIPYIFLTRYNYSRGKILSMGVLCARMDTDMDTKRIRIRICA